MTRHCKECRGYERWSVASGCHGCAARRRRQNDSDYTPPPYDYSTYAPPRYDSSFEEGARAPDPVADSTPDVPSSDTFTGGGGDFGGGGASGEW